MLRVARTINLHGLSKGTAAGHSHRARCKPREVLGAALGRAFRLLAIGSAVGIILGVLATRVLSHIVYQSTPKDPIVLCGVILSMLTLGMVAACIPARHARAVDPMILLREE